MPPYPSLSLSLNLVLHTQSPRNASKPFDRLVHALHNILMILLVLFLLLVGTITKEILCADHGIVVFLVDLVVVLVIGPQTITDVAVSSH